MDDILLAFSKKRQGRAQTSSFFEDHNSAKIILGTKQCLDATIPCENGTITNGNCECLPGWLGPSCDTSYQNCRDDFCSSRGQCGLVLDSLGYQTVTCACDDGYEGDQCDQHSCEVECGENGVCTGAGTCRCWQGWEGVGCNVTVVATEMVCPSSMEQGEGRWWYPAH